MEEPQNISGEKSQTHSEQSQEHQQKQKQKLVDKHSQQEEHKDTSKLQEKDSHSKSEKKLEHKHYTIVEKEEDADAVGWIFANEEEFIKVPFKFEEMPEDQIRLDILYTGLCNTDIEIGRNKWKATKYPICTGHEIVGRVSKIGSHIKNLKVGDVVAFGSMRACCGSCNNCENNQEQLCTEYPREVKEMSGEYWGGYATACQHPAQFVVKLPENIPLECAPPLICAGLTCFTPISRFARPGMRVAVIGIGGLGHMAIMLLSKFGTNITAFSRSLDMADQIKSLGAHEVASSVEPEDLKKYEGKFDFIINTLPKAKEDVFDSYLKMTANGGTFVMVGVPPKGEKISFNPETSVLHGINLVGSLCGSRKNLIDTLDFASLHEIFPKIELFDFEDFPKALDRLENEKPEFRCVVNVKDWAEKHGLHKKADK